MNLKNGYKVLYDAVDGAERVITASKTGTPEGAEEILRTAMGEYKLIYQNAEGKVCGSATGIPAADDKVFTEFDKVFVEDTESEDTVEPDNEEDEGTDGPVVDPTDEPQDPEVTEPEDESGDEPEQIPEPAEGEDEPTVDQTEA